MSKQNKNQQEKPTPVLPLDQVIPNTSPHHISVDIIDETLGQARKEIEKIQQDLPRAEKQVEQGKAIVDNLKLRYTVLDAQFKTLSALKAKIVELDVPASLAEPAA
jgi:chromosome segregation ATPase